MTFCPICRATLSKPFKAKKLPKNFIALDFAVKHSEQMKKQNFCTIHPKEMMRHYCITCKTLICIECIVDHSGHEFVKKEESAYILKENAESIVQDLEDQLKRTEQILQKGDKLKSQIKAKKIKDIQEIESKFERIIKSIQLKKAKLKKEYNDTYQGEISRIDTEMENVQKHASLITFQKNTVLNIVGELENFTGKKVQGSEVSNKLENFRKNEDELRDQTKKLKPAHFQDFSVSFQLAEMEGFIDNLGNIEQAQNMTSKKICYFGDNNKVMSFDLETQQWAVKNLPRASQEFLYYAAAVTLPTGDALIIGGGSSATVFMYNTATSELVVKKAMQQMRKEHAAVANENMVYVMGGYDGMQNAFLNSCEQYSIASNEWTYFAPMNISKCAFSATVVNKKYIYTFGGYDGQKRLDAIERYIFSEEAWELIRLKLKFALSNCACYSPDKSKVIIFGGGFSSGFSPYVEMVDVEKEEWKSLPTMIEGRDLRNKVVFTDGFAYAVGGLNRKAERFHFAKKQWQQLPDYPIMDNLDSWACSLTFIPQKPVLPKPKINNTSEEEKEFDLILQQEKVIDAEIEEEVRKFRNEREMGFGDIDADDLQLALEEEEDQEPEMLQSEPPASVSHASGERRGT